MNWAARTAPLAYNPIPVLWPRRAYPPPLFSAYTPEPLAFPHEAYTANPALTSARTPMPLPPLGWATSANGLPLAWTPAQLLEAPNTPAWLIASPRTPTPL